MSEHLDFRFLKPGFQTLLVDNNAIGYQQYGVPVGGPMDEESANAANHLVGNKKGAALFEITLMGPKIIFNDKCQIAICGANLSPKLDGAKIKMDETIAIQRGQVLNFGKLLYGCRAYLAIRGKWRHEETNKEAIEPINGLNNVIIETVSPLQRGLKTNALKLDEEVLKVEAFKGPEYELLTKANKEKLINTIFTLLPASNRMGYRLSPSLSSINKSIISSGVVPGTLQITEDGFPILLMKDAPATGGYVRALNVKSEDLSKLGQLKPGDCLIFNMTEE